MASQPPVSTKNQLAGGAPARPQLPPDEEFWQRYSPHHEAPLSGIGSFAMHFLLIGFLIVAGYLGWLGFGSQRTPANNDVVRLETPGGGSPEVVRDSPGNGGNQEVADTRKPDEPAPAGETSPKPEKTELNESGAAKPDIPADPAPKDDAKRIIMAGNEAMSGLSDLDKDIDAKLRESLRKSEKTGSDGNGGRSGTGGKKGSGKPGPGGDVTSDVSGPERTKREIRNDRWQISSYPQTGQEYVRQLRGIGAIIAIPKDRTGREYLVIRDLSTLPPKMQVEDLSQLGRMHWINRSPLWVAPLMAALGLHMRPSNFILFLPQDFEQKMLEEELKFHGLQEEDIARTVFDIRRDENGKYYPVVVDQQRQ